ncbi:unnamed protein product, partial [marine sediment metagenome]
SFDQWEGNLTGSNNLETIVMDGDKVVIAMFTETPIYLYITVVGNGSVTKDPDLPCYPYGTVVMLIAYPNIGWSFDRWSGDLNGTENPTTIFMNSSKEVTATFTEGQYVLDITINGNGNVTKNPEQETYIYGTSVNLTAVSDTYWIFKEWSGDLNGSENPETIVITANTTVIATFIQQGWLATMTIDGDIESPALLHMEDYVYFGERVNASDGVDEGIDIPYPGEPPAPYIAAWFKTDFEEPY